MRWTIKLRLRLRSLFRSSRVEQELGEELQYHLERLADDYVASGMSASEARDAARREMGAIEQRKEECRDARGVAVLDGIRRDVIYALRGLRKSPAFTTVAILSLALGIGANTAIFTLWNGVLRAPLPAVDAPEALVMLSNPDQSGSWTGSSDGPRSWLTYSEFEQLRDHVEGFSGVMASQSSLDAWHIRIGDGGWEEARGRLVSGGFFEVLGVGAAIGRLFTADEDRTDAPNLVISYDYWQRRFGGRADVLGTTVIVHKTALTIIGVAAHGFIGETSGQQPDVWLPLRLQPSVLPGSDRLHDTPPQKAMWLHVFAGLKPGVTYAQAEAQANAIFRAGLESFYGGAVPGERLRAFLNQHLVLRSGARGASATRTAFFQSLTALLAAVGLLLLIACANLANLLLARGAARKPEIALRLSLGASRGRLVRQLVTESVALAVIGGIAAVAVAAMLHGALVRMMAESNEDFRMTFALDPLVLAFLLAATIAAALLFGVLPAWQVTKTDAGTSLKEQGRGAIATRRQLLSGRLLVSLQLALTLPLLVGAGLLARTVYNLQHADLGFPSERLLLVRLNVREAGYEMARRDSLLRDLRGRIQQIPGVQATSFSELGVFTGGESLATIDVEGYVATRDEDRASALDVVGPAYFSALGVPMTLGRDIQESDHGIGASVCVINDAFAQRFFNRRNPIGMRITLINDRARTSYQVVGVAMNARTQNLRGAVAPRFFVPAKTPSSSTNSPTFLIRTSTDPATVMAAVLKTIEVVDASLPIISASSVEEEITPLTAHDRTTAQLAVGFGSVALTLAAIGLYGVLAYGVARRTGEIAIRIALGAQSGRVISMILSESAGLVATGLALGAGLAYAASRLLDSQLYGVTPQDPVTVALAIGLLLLVAVIAAYLPARHASRLDPMAALRL